MKDKDIKIGADLSQTNDNTFYATLSVDKKSGKLVNIIKLEAKLRDLEVGTFIKYDNEVFMAVGIMDPESKKVLCVSKSGKEIYLELDTKVELIPYKVNRGSDYE